MKQEDNLVTVAIHSFEKAQILKTLLESEGVEVYIHNVNLIQPMVSAGVRIRIKESDLPKALGIIEKSELLDDKYSKARLRNKILVPVDFSDYSLNACDFAFQVAALTGSEVVLLNVYFNPVYNSIPFLDSIPYAIKDEEVFRRIVAQSTADMENLNNILSRKIEIGELPEVKFSSKIQDGIPEEVIVNYCKEDRPRMIVMGTRGKDRKEIDLIGSVTAEIIERCKVPVFTIPEKSSLNIKNISNIGFITNFSTKDLIAFDKLINSKIPFISTKIYFVYIEQDANETLLEGVKSYISKQYPALNVEYTAISDENILHELDVFIEKEKIDIVSVNAYKRNIFARLFNPSIARKMLFHSNTPMLIFHA